MRINSLPGQKTITPTIKIKIIETIKTIETKFRMGM